MNGQRTKPHVYCLMGATATGKTALAAELVARHPFQIISVDSAQVYRGMDIGTGKPGPALLAQAPHRLIDIRDPAEVYSASDFRADALTEIEAVLAEGGTPLLVGGTMLYFKALRDGLASMPSADPDIRRQIEDLAARAGWEAVHQQLARVDPESAGRIHPNDPQRLQRALEVFLVSGRTMTALREQEQQRGRTQDELPFQLHFFALQPPDRAALHETIAQRFHAMLAAGLVDEVRRLHQRGDLNELLPAIKSVGYRQVWRYLEGEWNYDEMVEKSIIATRQLAKRQLTWLRSWDDLQALGGPTVQSVANVLNYVHSAAI